jgi:hypothetical protein
MTKIKTSLPPGAIQLRVLRGNSPGVVTEVLLQKLESVHRAAYAEKYRSAEFSEWTAGEWPAFEAGSLRSRVPRD